MKYIHIKNLEKYHPGYKDRSLIWCKIFFSMINADPEFELLEEIDKWRFIAFIILELQSKKPTPIDNAYLCRKGFDLKKRPISLTLKMLHSFIEYVTVALPRVEYSRVEYSRVDKNRIDTKDTIQKKPTSLQEVVDYYFTIRDYISNKEWTNQNYPRHAKTASRLLKIGNVKEVQEAITKGKAYFEEKGLDWKLETIEKRWNEIKAYKGKIKYS